MMWRFDFKVVGRGPFPVDMLRYDQCFPTEEGEHGSSAILRSFELGNNDALEVHLTRHGQTRDECLKVTPLRWSSRGWEVDYFDTSIRHDARNPRKL